MASQLLANADLGCPMLALVNSGRQMEPSTAAEAHLVSWLLLLGWQSPTRDGAGALATQTDALPRHHSSPAAAS